MSSGIELQMNKSHESRSKIHRLPGLLAGDIAAAAVSASLISPLVTAIDRAVVENAAEPLKRPLLSTLRSHVIESIREPRRMMTSKPFLIIWTLYCVTYATANTAETIAWKFMPYAEQAAVSGIAFLPTFIINVPLGVWKDVRFAKIFGTFSSSSTSGSAAVQSPKTHPLIVKPQLPWMAISTFLFRDAITLFGSFALTPLLSTAVPDALATNAHTKAIVTQLFAPILSQLVATPLHLLGLDLIRRPNRLAWSERRNLVRSNLGAATAMRCVRILPAFSVGCVVNTELKRGLHGLVDADTELEAI